MLVLERKRNQRIVMTTKSGEVITVDVPAIGPRSVKLGISAPPTVTIRREELATPPDPHAAVECYEIDPDEVDTELEPTPEAA